ncbi:hypothetical protein AYI69_g6690 [Smittium culicis]|uniref:Uncharacterized protein n=1 Tax=Smittium culicis TaxID=133412 RepID=A0A1R1XX87_9FUNG|nr:hypothetical protein AYI69_g6690 [Smittium culicis]
MIYIGILEGAIYVAVVYVFTHFKSIIDLLSGPIYVDHLQDQNTFLILRDDFKSCLYSTASIRNYIIGPITEETNFFGVPCTAGLWTSHILCNLLGFPDISAAINIKAKRKGKYKVIKN